MVLHRPIECTAFIRTYAEPSQFRRIHPEERMNPQLASYILRYYGYLMTNEEKAAHKHLLATLKATHGRSDVVAQQEASEHSHLGKLLSRDPDALKLAGDGIQIFAERAASRILNEHR